MYYSIGIVVFGFQLHVYCFENLCRHPSTSVLQSSTYKSNIATLVIDGDTRTSEKYCAHTEVNQTKAWLQIDLGQPLNIGNVQIFYRKEGIWKPYRFRQFYLDVSNTSATQTKTAHRTRCYTDNTAYPSVPPNIIDIPCKHTARYVILETTYDAPEDNPTTGAILEICEIEVYGYNSGETNAASKDTTIATSTAITATVGDRVYSGVPTLDITTTRHYRGESIATTLPLQVNTNSSTITAAGIPAEATITSGTPEEAITTSSTTREVTAISGTTEEADVATVGASHHHSSHEEDQGALTLVGEGLGSTVNIENSSHTSPTDPTTTATPDVLTCSTSTILVNLSQKSNNTASILYVMLPVLCTSLVINFCTITWILRNNACKRRDVIQDDLKTETKFIPTTGIYMYDTSDDDTVYQELDQLSGPSHYSQL